MAQRQPQTLADPEDLFNDTRMSFGDHIEELRTHLFRAIYGFVIAMTIAVLPPVGPYSLKFITRPVEDQLIAFYDRYYDAEWKRIQNDEARKAPAVPMVMRIHGPSLKRILEEKKPGPRVLEKMIPAVENVFQRLAIDIQPIDHAEDPDWFELPVELPDPIALAKTMSDLTRIIKPERLSTFNVQETFIVYIKVSLLVGFVMASPWVFYQIWAFIAAGLYPHEKRLVNVYLPVSLGLFLGGFFVCEFLALPKAIEALLWFNEWLGFQPDLRLSEWLGFALMMPLVFGLSFQTPLVMLFFFKIGIFGIDTYTSKRRISYFIMAVFAAVITPSTDAPTMMMLWVPMCLLFEVGIILCRMQPKSLEEDLDESDLDAMVGV